MKDFPIYFTFDRNYVIGACITFHSLLKHLSKEYFCHLYVLHTKLTEADYKRLKKVVDRFENAELSFINVSDYEKNLETISPKAHFSKEIFYKLIAAEIFPQYERIVCSDVDVVFKDNLTKINTLFPDDDFYFAGVGAVEKGGMEVYKAKFTEEESKIIEHEIAAGLLLMNLKKIREDNLQEKLLNFYVNNYDRFCLPEQDCIILTCWPHVKYLPMEYVIPNIAYGTDMSNKEFYTGNPNFSGTHEESLAKYNYALENPIQLHYVGFNKPWNSIFIKKQIQWFKELAESKCILYYICSLPHNMIVLRLRRYNIQRFIGKLKARTCK